MSKLQANELNLKRANTIITMRKAIWCLPLSIYCCGDSVVAMVANIVRTRKKTNL